VFKFVQQWVTRQLVTRNCEMLEYRLRLAGNLLQRDMIYVGLCKVQFSHYNIKNTIDMQD